jgi:D-xylose transport system ATP-binding protein
MTDIETPDNDIIIEVKNVTKQFPGVTALKDVSVKIRRGEIHGFCGENGAGKSTLMKIFSGVYPHGEYEGIVVYEGEELQLERGAIQKATQVGIATVYQELTLVPTMTVGENVYLGREPVEYGGINWDKLYSDTEKLLARYGLDIQAQELVSGLGVGKQQMTEIAKALSENAKVLILDEPTSALTDAEIEQLMDILRRLKENGVTCIYITHKLEEFFKIADSITVLRDGKVITSQPTEELTEELLVNHMVGREMTERFPPGNRNPGKVVLEVHDLHALDPKDSKKEVIRGVSFDLRKGEILGIAGLMGSGRTELAMTIFGEYAKITNGTIALAGNELNIRNANDAMHEGISLVPEDRKNHGLVLMQSVLKNISLPNLNQFASWMRIDQLAELNSATKFSKSLEIKAPNLLVSCDSLSGGNQQKVVISKWLMSNPQVLIMDDPTRGIDVGAKFEIYKLMNDLASQGIAIIMISSELEEVLGMSDRVMVMCEGRSAGILDISEASQEKIMALATGISDGNGTEKNSK